MSKNPAMSSPYSSSPSYFSTIHGGSSTPTSNNRESFPSASSSVPPPPLISEEGKEEGKDDVKSDKETGDMSDKAELSTSTPFLQSRLATLRQHSNDLGSQLTKKLATSRSGQSLLHIGPSLSTLPPDLQSLLEALSPLHDDVEAFEKDNRRELGRVVEKGEAIMCAVSKGQFARQCAEMYRDLVGAEEILRGEVERRMRERPTTKRQGNLQDNLKGNLQGNLEDDLEEESEDEELDHVTSLERAAYTTLHLLQQLQTSSAQVSAMTGVAAAAVTPHVPDDSNHQDTKNQNTLPSISRGDGVALGAAVEKSRFLMKLSPRIRRLESDTTKCLVARLEGLLAQVRILYEGSGTKEITANSTVASSSSSSSSWNQQIKEDAKREELLLMIGNCLRGLALLGKGSEAENAFARVAVMPIIRSKLSMGRLDEGGSRGECAGLFFLLDDIANTVASMYGSILRASEGMFSWDGRIMTRATPMDVDLVTCGVWVPVATALMADPGIKMAIFSPGIANVLQANYSALDTFLSELADNLLKTPHTNDPSSDKEEKSSMEPIEPGDFSHLYYQPTITSQSIEQAQSRLYKHPTTVEFSKKWNLPIYYQLRFAEFCKRLDKALETVRKEGWHADVFTGDKQSAKQIQEELGFELPLFLELYDILLHMWKSNVFLRPLAHRFLRGAVQLVGRTVAFVKDGLDGNIQFGGNPAMENEAASSATRVHIPAYFWNERVEDLAVVTWELTILDTCMTHDYLEVVAQTVCPTDEGSRNAHNTLEELQELRALASEILIESSQEISPLVSRSWNNLIVDNLTAKCCNPLSAVKGVAATYRMTNRPPPTQASPFVATILRPLKEFDATYASRTPPQIGDDWKYQVISTVSSKYSIAVEELIATVKRTEEALKSRKTRRMMAGGMSDGEKVKLQLFLDHREFASNVKDLGMDENDIEGLVKLRSLTKEAEGLLAQSR